MDRSVKKRLVRLQRFAAPLLLVASGLLRAETTLITNATLLSGESPTPRADSWLRIEDGRIAATGTGSVDTGDALTIDAGGGYLIPGLIDGHVHLYHATGLKRRYTDGFERLYRAYMAQQPRSFLYFGFTTVVELNADFDDVERFTASRLRPDLVHCGQGVVLDNGFMALEVGADRVAAAYPGFLVDHYARGRDEPGDSHSPAAAVDYVRERGGRCIKMYCEEALWWPGGAPEFALPSVEIVRDVVASAHGYDMPVLLHATTPAGHRFALETGVDILAHGMWDWPEQDFDAPTPLPAYRQIAAAVADSGIWLQPTLTTIRNTASMFDPSVLDDPNWRHAVPAGYLDYLRGDAQAQREEFIERFGPAFPPGTRAADLPELQRRFNERFEALVVGMVEAGAKLAFGTDTAVGGYGWAAPPGLAGLREIRAWAEAGVPLAVLFEALTINNARALRLIDDRGTLERGKRADMLLLDSNPLDSADVYDDIRLVIVGGEVIERGLLSAAPSEP